MLVFEAGAMIGKLTSYEADGRIELVVKTPIEESADKRS